MADSIRESRGNRIRLVVAYDGAGFHGFARQDGLRTVQATLEETLTRMLSTPIEVHGSGRTDKGVHARAQVVHFDLPYGPPAERMVYVLRRRLPADIIPLWADRVDTGFHARFSVVRKTYRYLLYRGATPNLFLYRFSWHVPGVLGVEAMREAAAHLLGRHDFTSFCASATPQEDKVRSLYRIDFVESPNRLAIEVEGSGFLQYMVRIIVGTLVKVGQGRERADRIPAILAAKDRRLAGETAPPHGLCLWNVEYPPEYGGKVVDPEADL
ncbi:tRNA pseudouridine synthase A [Alicyclobacillus hesperidum subsp. aegles]|uniref:tRNA pseudouridine(38-40) synthase TruA n=1 Tax=Alicyclobacillus hesperidum TaxID=89784 RepID=UPI00222ADF46|nr:tRNA pseudouridine(38-40) synthase TruA [Alicyclobacillus hesperidum]GLG02625.1 tRNA pseudouridine synthase A [Alicyclobacillus hesperidum subsp. aegles]